MKIFIDPGHNHSGTDTGAQGNGLKEQEVTFGIAEVLRKLLVAVGHEVRMSRNSLTDNVGNSLSSSIGGRAEGANRFGADLFVSIHCNAGGGTGCESLIYARGGRAETVATAVQRALVGRLGLRDRGVKVRSELGVLRLTKMPALLVETAFIDNPQDASLLRSKQQTFAEAIFTGLTGDAAPTGELTEVNDLVWELAERGIITDTELWLTKLAEDKNSYYLAQKTVKFLQIQGV